MVQGDTGVIRMRIHNYELSQGDEVRFAIVNKANPSILLCQHSDKKIVLEKQVTVFEKDGSARIVIQPYDTEYLQPGKYLYEIQVKTKDSRVDTVVPLTSFTLMDGSIQGEYIPTLPGAGIPGGTEPSVPGAGTPGESEPGAGTNSYDIEVRFKRLENEIIPELGTRITNVENEIDGINSSLDNKTNEIRNINLPQNYNGGIAVFTDDDGYSTVIDKWVNDICVEKDIKISIGVISKYTYNADKLNATQLKELQTQGYDLLSHSYEHINLNNATVEQAKNDFVQDHNWWISNGFEVPKTLVYPWGLDRANEEMKTIVRKYYSYGLHSSTNFNGIPLDNMWVQRVDLARKTLDELKQEVTNAYYNNGLIVFYTHSQYPEGDGANYFPTQKIKDLIDYIKTVRKMPIMTFSEAIKLKGNVIQAGEGSKYDRFFALSNDGRVSMPQNVNIVKDRSYHINTSIVNFPDKTLSIVAVSQEDDTMLNKGGNLFIYRYDTGNSFEMFMPNGTVDVYKRNWTYGASNWEGFINLHPKNSTERITLTTDDLGSLSANTLKKVQKTLSTNLNLNNYIIIVNPIGCPYNIMWSYGINYSNKTIEFSLLSPVGTTPSAGINYDISFVPKS